MNGGNFDFLRQHNQALAEACDTAEGLVCRQSVDSLKAAAIAGRLLLRALLERGMAPVEATDFTSLIQVAEVQRLVTPNLARWLRAIQAQANAASSTAPCVPSRSAMALGLLHRACAWFCLGFYGGTVSPFHPPETPGTSELERRLCSEIDALRFAETIGDVKRAESQRSMLKKTQRELEAMESLEQFGKPHAAMALPGSDKNAINRDLPSRLEQAERVAFSSVSFAEQFFVEESLSLPVAAKEASLSVARQPNAVIQLEPKPNLDLRTQENEELAFTSVSAEQELQEEWKIALAPIGALGWFGSSIGGAIAYRSVIASIPGSSDEQLGGAILHAFAGGFGGFLLGALVGGVFFAVMKRKSSVFLRTLVFLACAASGSIAVQCGLALGDGLPAAATWKVASNAGVGWVLGMSSGYVLARLLRAISL